MKNGTLFMMSILLLVGCINSVFAQPPQHTYDLRMVVVRHDYAQGGFFDVQIDIISDGISPFIMGDANLVFEYNSTGLSAPVSFTPHNFSGGDYDQMTVTTPTAQLVSVNIVRNGTGTTVIPSWMPVVTIRLTILDIAQTSNLVWHTTPPLPVQVFDDQSQLIPPDDLNNLDVVLPVELTSFTAHFSDGQVVLNWSTKTETNNVGFDVERSLDNKSFKKVGFVKGKTTTIIPQEYVFKDKQLDPGRYYYRLKQIDLNGSFEYSEVVEITVLPPEEFALLQNYPNPFNPETTIRYELPTSSRVVLTIFNVLGKEVRTLVNDEQSAGIKTVIWDGKDNHGTTVGSGMYYYHIQTKDYSKTLKLIFMK